MPFARFREVMSAFYLFDRQNRDFLYAGHAPNVHNIQAWARSKPGVRNSIQILHVGVRNNPLLAHRVHVSRKADVK